MSVFARPGTHSVFVPADKTASGRESHVHNLAYTDGDVPAALTCAECEPYLRKEGWSSTPGFQSTRRDPRTGELIPYGPGVPPTADMLERRRRTEDEGNASVQQMGRALAEAAKGIAGQGTAEPDYRAMYEQSQARLTALEQKAAEASKPEPVAPARRRSAH